ncbi:MAG: YheC/YheD family protein [Turicibacter sanguinis]|uniref:YheC/YheD family endospore coat-associated protein n=1 Tax=Turicibacter sanguinis TaxID=154288 RepID=UPI002F93CE3B
MILIGMLHHRKMPTSIERTSFYALAAKEEGVDFIYFSPKGVDFKNKVINGYVYKDGIWKRATKRFPDVIFNAGSPAKLNRAKQIVNRLRKEIPFTSYPVGNKMAVYKRLKKAKVFSRYLIPTQTVSSTQELLKFIQKNGKIVFKPVGGHQGEGVTFIERKGQKFLVQFEGVDHIYTLSQLNEFVSKRILHTNYLVQRYINSKNSDGEPTDFRLHVHKDGNKKWIISVIYARSSTTRSLITNVHQGAKVAVLDDYLKEHNPRHREEMKKKLEIFAIKLANHLDDLQEKSHLHKFDELGIDIGIDEHNNIWIYEVNWLPGTPHSFYGKYGIETNTIRYAASLCKK